MIESRKKKLIVKTVSGFFMCFILFNVVVFLMTMSHHVNKKLYLKGSAYMAAASTVNFVYIFPLARGFCYRNFMTKPFYSVRDFLYAKGYACFPENAGEKEMWWFAVRNSEFEEFVSDDVLKYYAGNKNIDVKYLIQWSDEIYAHLYPLATNSLKNQFFRKYRFQTYIALSYWYIRERTKLLSDISDKSLYPFQSKHEEIIRIQNILKWFDTLKSYARLNEKEAYEAYAQRTTSTWFQEYDLKLEATMHIIYYDLYNGFFDCDNRWLSVYLASRAILNSAKDDLLITKKSKEIISRRLGEGMHNFFYHEVEKKCRGNFK